MDSEKHLGEEISQELHEKPKDWLPKGPNFESEYVEWGPGGESRGLMKRIGKPRIEDNPYFNELEKRIEKFKEKDPDKLKYFEAGSGHGNDFRVVKDLLSEEGVDVGTLGVEYSEKEIRDGLKFYKDRDKDREEQRDINESIAQGDLRDLKNIKFLNPENGKFDKVEEVKDGTYGVIYFEAILHAFGMGKESYKEKKANAMKMLKELHRIAQPGAMFFGRASVWGPDESGSKVASQEKQFNLLRQWDEWRFVPGSEDEFKTMLEEAGFEIEKTKLIIRENEKRELRKKWPRVSFMCRKPE